MNYDVDQINHLIRNRRSVFIPQFEQDRVIPKEIITEMLTNACWAPSHGQKEPWSFTVFSGEGLKKLAEFQAQCYKETTPDNFKQGVYDKLLENPLKCSHIISLGMKRDPMKKFPEIEEIAAASCAVQNLYLSTTAYGLGGYWTTGGITYRPAAKQFFNLGEDDILLGFFYLGYVAVPSAPGTRRPLEEHVNWVE